MKNKTSAIVLINIGSPEELSVSAVRKYLRCFLMDPYVLQIPYVLRWLLVYVIISLFRAPKTLKKYRSIWTDLGSPLNLYSKRFREKLAAKTGQTVELGMMYSAPLLRTALTRLRDQEIDSITLVPLYPQYAESTTESALARAKELLSESRIANYFYVDSFYQHPSFIDSVAENVRRQFSEYQNFDHVIFSYHGLPESHLNKNQSCSLNDCCDSLSEKNKFCYRAQCFRTTFLIAQNLQISKDSYSTVFQSRLGRTEWIKPYLESECFELAKINKRRILLISPSFVVDGLETLQEISDLNIQIQQQYPDFQIYLVKALNDQDFWVDGFIKILETKKPLY